MVLHPDKKFLWYWKRSLLAHGIILFLMLMANKLNFFNLANHEPKIILPSVRVDIVELPKHTLEELKKIEIAPPPTKVEEKSVEKNIPVEKVVPKEKLDNAFEEIVKKTEKKLADKQIENLKKLNELKKTEERRDEMKQLLLAGNKVQAGTQVQGEEITQELTEFDNYILEVTEKVRYQWKLPSYLKNLPLKCRIQLFINAEGLVQVAKIMESSGNEEYDNWALKSIKDAAPFKIPAQSILPDLLRGKFVLGYPL
jgi:colicin import membrane protein